ncbi:MAG: hypothetical protein Hens2KO_23050 [Henriciella sp.]
MPSHTFASRGPHMDLNTVIKRLKNKSIYSSAGDLFGSIRKRLSDSYTQSVNEFTSIGDCVQK